MKHLIFGLHNMQENHVAISLSKTESEDVIFVGLELNKYVPTSIQ